MIQQFLWASLETWDCSDDGQWAYAWISSAYMWAWKLWRLNMLSMPMVYIRNRRGPRPEPWGTPCSSEIGSEVEAFQKTCALLVLRYDENQDRAVPLMPALLQRLWRRVKWSTVSKAALRLNRPSRVSWPLSAASMISELTLRTAVSVEKRGQKADCRGERREKWSRWVWSWELTTHFKILKR